MAAKTQSSGSKFSLSAAALNFIPGLIILVFSMLALYCALRIIDDRTDLSKFYMQLNRDIQYNQQDFYAHLEESENIALRMAEREQWLYWSIIAVGFSGFILIILHGDKLKKLQQLNEERSAVLHLLEQRLAAMEATFDGIGIVDAEGRLIYMNKALMKLHGIDLEEKKNYINSSWGNLYTKKGRDIIQGEVFPKLEMEGYWQGESPIVQSDGTVVFAELSLTQLPGGGFIGTARDITERRRAEEEKQKLQEQFFQSQKMEAVGRLAGGIAHDFNNILAAINGFAEFLIDDLDKKTPQHDFAQKILQAGLQARNLVDQILAFSRHQGSEMKSIALSDTVKETLSMVKVSFPKSIEVDIALDLPQSQIVGNATQISQLVMNLCVNAIDAMEDRHGRLSISLTAAQNFDQWPAEFMQKPGGPKERVAPMQLKELAPGRTQLYYGWIQPRYDYVVLRIADSGMGISRMIMEHMFEPFFTTKAVGKGTGLGLATVHGIVTGHQAALIVDSVIGQGTTFELYFPLSKEKADIQEVISHMPSGGGQGTILLVEDQEDVRHMMLKMLERGGYRADFVSNGLEAVDKITQNPALYDLVITDHNMPKMTGLELVCNIYANHPDIPFVLLSGYSQEELQDLMKEHPAIKVILRKPATSQSIMKAIEKHMRKDKQKSSAA